MAVRNLVFDIGGVLIGFRSPEMLVEAGFTQDEIDEFSRKVFLDPLWKEFDLENIPYDEIVEAYVQKYPEEEEMIHWVFSHTHLMPVHWPEVWEKVRALRDCGYRLYFLSNYSSVMFRNHLTGVWALDEMDGGVVSCQVHRAKPDPEIYQILLEKYDLKPEECVFFDDRGENVEGARAVGMQSRQVEGKEHMLEMLDEYLQHPASDHLAADKESLRARFIFRAIRPDEGEKTAMIEQVCFPPNEACRRETMLERTERLSDTFLVAEDRESGQIAGFINGIATKETAFRDEFFTDVTLHDPQGDHVMILGLDVLPEYRCQGLASELVRQFYLQAGRQGRRALVLTCLPEKIPMYRKFGFRDLGLSASAWGGEAWHEMIREIDQLLVL